MTPRRSSEGKAEQHHERPDRSTSRNGGRRREGKPRSVSREKNEKKESKARRHGHRSASRQPPRSSDSSKRYIYSAISATFFFVLLRELGWLEGNSPTGTYLKGAKTHMKPKSSKIDPDLYTSSKARTVALAGTSSAGGMQAQIEFKTKAPKKIMSRKEVMDAIIDADGDSADNDELAGRPIMYTFFEWIPPRNRGTQMSDQADLELMKEWKLAWRTAGWNPKVLTLDDAKKHSSYETYSPELTKIQMLGVDGMGGNVVYNQLCFLRWLAVSAAGGGYMADYDVFPISLAPKSIEPPFGGNFTVYSKIKNSQGAGIPCLMSGSEQEWTRMAYAILENGLKHAKTDSMWSDMLAIIDMRAERAYQLRDVVAEGQDVLLKNGWTENNCDSTKTKKAIHFSHEAMRKGYLRPGESTEDRPYIIRRFLQKWHNVCTQTVLDEADMPDREELAQAAVPKQTWTKKKKPVESDSVVAT